MASKQAKPLAFTLPPDFLSGPGPGKIIQKIDFAQTPLPEYKGLYAVIIDNAFTKQECEDLVRAAEARTSGEWEQAMINVGGGYQMLMTDARDCSRIIWDDVDVVEKIWSRLKDSVLPDIEYLKDAPRVTGLGPKRRGETLKMTRLNERMRFLKYKEAQYFRPHVDGSFVTPDNKERSLYTLHVYLNESDANSPEGPLVGGATTFHSHDGWDGTYDVHPKVGRALIFQHRGLLHSGADVLGGVKLTLRTDLMYETISAK